jgi:hypothetical protein
MDWVVSARWRTLCTKQWADCKVIVLAISSGDRFSLGDVIGSHACRLEDQIPCFSGVHLESL